MFDLPDLIRETLGDDLRLGKGVGQIESLIARHPDGRVKLAPPGAGPAPWVRSGPPQTSGTMPPPRWAVPQGEPFPPACHIYVVLPNGCQTTFTTAGSGAVRRPRDRGGRKRPALTPRPSGVRGWRVWCPWVVFLNCGGCADLGLSVSCGRGGAGVLVVGVCAAAGLGLPRRRPRLWSPRGV